MGGYEPSRQAVEGHAHVGEHVPNYMGPGEALALDYVNLMQNKHLHQVVESIPATVADNVDSHDDAIESGTGQSRKLMRDNFDPYGIHNYDKNDPVIEAFSDLSLNTPLPEKFPDLTTKEADFAKAATDLLITFADNFPKPAAADALTGLAKQFRDTMVTPDVVNAINLLLDEQHLTHPVRLGLSEVTGLLCLGTDDGDGHFTKRFDLSDNRGIKR